MSDFEDKRKFPRVEVQWPVTIMVEKGSVEGEARNVSVDGMYILFIRPMGELALNKTYRLLMHPWGQKIEVMGKLVWSNPDILPGKGFCFVEVSEGDREFLRKAIQKYGEK